MGLRKLFCGIFAFAACSLHGATPRELIASALVLEDVEDGVDGMWGVGCVIQNRVALRHTDPVYEVLRKKQFSSMREKDPVFRAKFISTPSQWRTALNLADGVLAGRLSDITSGATHFCRLGVYPYWTYKMPCVATIGSLNYYREKLHVDEPYRANWMHLHPTFATP